MEILIFLDAAEPPAGRVWRVPREHVGAEDDIDTVVEFVGWLGLLRALDGVIGRAEDDAHPRVDDPLG